MALVSWWVVRLALRPIDRMRDAMADFGRDITRPALPLDGPIELRRTFETFNQMQDQIRAFMTERTDMLAAITHDLKTPLTRMRLRLEDVSEIDTKKKLQDDLLFMQRLIDEGLELAKSHHSSEPQREIELTFLIQSLCDDLADAGHDVQFEDSGFRSGMLVYAQAFCLRRIFENLLDNAIKYGMRARVRVRETPTYIYVTIEDDGPGIPESQIAGVLDPFVRLENSRSRETGGTGLGLAIASNLVQAQGGVLHLRNREHGGLEVEVILNRLKRMASD
jgi:signal transduction histidine kinase